MEKSGPVGIYRGDLLVFTLSSGMIVVVRSGKYIL